MRLVDVTQPTKQPVTLGEAREQCRILDNSHDTKLLMYINAAVGYVERYTETRLMSRTVRQEMDAFPDGVIKLKLAPVTAVTSVVYDNASNNETTLTLNTDYREALSGAYPTISPVDTWPTAISKPSAIRITMTVGYTNRDDVPNDLRLAILKMVQDLFANNGDSISGMTNQPLNFSVRALCDMHRRYYGDDA